MSPTASQQALANLQKVDHLVVLMMENRSFDHMLGYLKLDGVDTKVEGLEARMGQTDKAGSFHEVQPIGKRLLNEKVLDPGHTENDVQVQLDPDRGFVQSYEAALEKNKQRYRYPPGLEFDPTLVLGYQRADDVPVYDYLARNYLVCDHWFSSVPGPTWENRLYAVTGGKGPRVLPKIKGKVPDFLTDAPLYDRPAFTHWLDDDAWRWYSHDPATLRMIDSRYRPGGGHGWRYDRNFAYFNRKSLFEWHTFIDDAANERLPRVSWVDPNFVDFRHFGPPGSNDDHPPSRVMLGQELVLNLLTALMRSPQWPRTLLLITYDEHGGFYDHVDPGRFPIPGDESHSYGVRVPALVVSPYVERGVFQEPFDHTSIIKTILLRFSDRAEQALDRLGPRTRHARHLGEVLTVPVDKPRPRVPEGDLFALAARVAEWRLRAYQAQLLEKATHEEELFAAVTDLQGEIVGASLHLRGERLVPDSP